jgi:putative flavoprotein involved in K+ transport
MKEGPHGQSPERLSCRCHSGSRSRSAWLSGMNEPLDVLVIGGGQAGLTMGYYLSRLGKRFQIVDSGTEIGEAWRSRWDSLILFTPAQYDSLPGMAFPAPHDTYPGKDDVADYLRAYVAKLELPLRLNTRVSSLTNADGGYVATAGAERFDAKQVVVATGPFQVPFVPPISNGFDPDLFQVHSVDYRHPGILPPGRVLVVGGANSGCQIARELSATHTVELSIGQRLPTVPQRPLGRDVWWWAAGLGLATRVTVNSRLGRRLAHRDQVIGDGPKQLARHHRVRIRPMGTSASGRTMTFADGTASDRCRRMDHGVQAGPLVDRCPWRKGRGRTYPARTWRDPGCRPLHARPAMAAHASLRAARMGGQGRGVLG